MFSPPPPDSPNRTNSLSDVFQSIFSYDGNVMLAAVVSLLLVILFVLLLHVYAKWFLAQSRHRRRRSMNVSHVLGPSRFHHFHTFNFDTSLSNSPTKSLDASVIATIPLFVYNNSEEHRHGLECVICLSPFEENEIGRDLPKCHHGFHVECIDMWLSSHANCPICRAPVVSEAKVLETNDGNSSVESLERVGGELGLTLSEHVDSNSTLEIVIDIPSCEINNQAENIVACDSLSISSPSSSLGCSLKRMLSRNKSERKVFPSSNVNQLNA